MKNKQSKFCLLVFFFLWASVSHGASNYLYMVAGKDFAGSPMAGKILVGPNVLRQILKKNYVITCSLTKDEVNYYFALTIGCTDHVQARMTLEKGTLFSSSNGYLADATRVNFQNNLMEGEESYSTYFLNLDQYKKVAVYSEFPSWKSVKTIPILNEGPVIPPKKEENQFSCLGTFEVEDCAKASAKANSPGNWVKKTLPKS